LRTKALSESGATHEPKALRPPIGIRSPDEYGYPVTFTRKPTHDMLAHVSWTTTNYDIRQTLHSSRNGYAGALSSGAPVLLFQSSREAPIDNDSTLALLLLRYSRQAHPAANQSGRRPRSTIRGFPGWRGPRKFCGPLPWLALRGPDV